MRLSTYALVLLESKGKDILDFHDPDSLTPESYNWIIEQDVRALRVHGIPYEPDEQHLNKETN